MVENGSFRFNHSFNLNQFTLKNTLYSLYHAKTLRVQNMYQREERLCFNVNVIQNWIQGLKNTDKAIHLLY